jgi:superfamily I DNA/RNA helicase
MSKLSKKQKEIVNAPLESFSTQACAGSGKTRTAVARVQKIRELVGEQRTHVLLLSFSNVAVQTFKEAFSKQTGAQVGNLVNSRISIETFDSFLTSNILRPHAYRTKECDRTPFLVSGSERFLLNDDYTFWYESSPRNIPIRGSELSKL